MLLIHPPGADFRLLPFRIVFIGLLAYAVLFMTALIGRKLAGFLKSALLASQRNLRRAIAFAVSGATRRNPNGEDITEAEEDGRPCHA